MNIKHMVSALALMAVLGTSAAAQVKVTTNGVTDTEIVVGSHQDLSGPIKGWGVGAANGLKMAVDEINAAGGINGRKLRLIVEDNGYDPRKAVLATQKMIESDKIYAMIAPIGSPTVIAAQQTLLDAGVLQYKPMTSAAFTYQMDPAKPQDRLKFSNGMPYSSHARAGLVSLHKITPFSKPCIMYQDDELGKNVLDGFKVGLTDLKLTMVSETTYKRGASDFSSQIAKMKADGCDLVMLGTVIRETVGAIVEAKKAGWNVPMLGTIAAQEQLVIALGKEAVEGFYATGVFEVPYEDTATGAAKEFLVNYKKAFNMDANSGAVIAYSAMRSFAHYAKLAGRDLKGDAFLRAAESGEKYQDIFGSPAGSFSPTNHLFSNLANLQVIKGGKWTIVAKDLKAE